MLWIDPGSATTRDTHSISEKARPHPHWPDRYFVLEGFQLYEFDEPSSSTARRVVDLRGTVANVHTDSSESSSADPMQRVFPFKVRPTLYAADVVRVFYSTGYETACPHE